MIKNLKKRLAIAHEADGNLASTFFSLPLADCTRRRGIYARLRAVHTNDATRW